MKTKYCVIQNPEDPKITKQEKANEARKSSFMCRRVSKKLSRIYDNNHGIIKIATPGTTPNKCSIYYSGLRPSVSCKEIGVI